MRENVGTHCATLSFAECKLMKCSAKLTEMSAIVTSKMLLSNTFHESLKKAHPGHVIHVTHDVDGSGSRFIEPSGCGRIPLCARS
eukprot:6469541-Amphidinium_carterae.1